MIVIIDADYNEEIGKAHIAGIVAETIFDEKEKMAGEYRLPYLVKYADSKARDWSI